MGQGSWLSSLLDSGWLDKMGIRTDSGGSPISALANAPKKGLYANDFWQSLIGKGDLSTTGGKLGMLSQSPIPSGETGGAYGGGFVDNSHTQDSGGGGIEGLSAILDIIAAFI